MIARELVSQDHVGNHNGAWAYEKFLFMEDLGDISSFDGMRHMEKQGKTHPP